ncbi:NUDIX hydrolase [Breznakiella homolactica]|uniref:NUDIX hydrolase n=1 Tax=Breznakiella homolactica TaxID=2798577 RepID=A0A7T7XRP3_9SPIR|nr:NUDIX hydrolase [Breznakiella homolactica]QQO11199.1 NUDIX hydrolase [Breznakiella homolactica]
MNRLHGPSGNTRRNPRDHLLASLERYRRQWPECGETADRILEFTVAGEDVFSRACPGGHITGSVFITSRDYSRVLLVHHKKLGLWVQPGGHCDPEETVYETALRESAEETGITAESVMGDAVFDAAVLPVPAWRDVPFHWHYDIRYLLAADTDAVRISAESHGAEWVTLDEAVIKNPEPAMFGAMEKIRRLQRGEQPAGLQLL